jgi:adenylate cyclase
MEREDFGPAKAPADRDLPRRPIDMHRMTYVIDGRVAPIAPGETILHASLRAGVAHAHACGGNARCSTCRVQIVAGLDTCAPRTDKEQLLATRLRFAPEVRLACQTTVSADLTIRRLVLDQTDVGLSDVEAAASGGVEPIGEERSLAIMFADIRGFTPFAEPLLAYDVVHALNRYYDEVGRVIAGHGGHIDNYMGDGLLAVFGMEQPARSAHRAVAAARGMIAAVERLKPYFDAVYGRSFDIGIGIHYGEVIVGAVGAAGRRRTTIIGDAVNVAARIESATKAVGVRVLISDATLQQLDERDGRWIPHRVALPGKSGEFVLYQMPDAP